MKRTCPCKLAVPLDEHDRNKEQMAVVEKFISQLGEYSVVQIGPDTWRISRWCIALHGVKAERLPEYGFELIRTVRES